MTTELLFLERMATAGVLASLAVAIAFGPEIRRVLSRMRNRRAVDVAADEPVGAEPQRF